MIYVLSDIHGHYSRYKSILRQIDLQRDDHLYVLGDCIDRNPFGLKILKELYLMPNATVLLGNHEYMMLDALTKSSSENEYIRRWYRNGGDITHARLLHCSKAYRQEMLDIIRTLPVNLEIRCGGMDYLLVHGGPLGCRHRYDDPVKDSVWMRLDETTALPEGKTVIFGHTRPATIRATLPCGYYTMPRMDYTPRTLDEILDGDDKAACSQEKAHRMNRALSF